MPWLRLAFFRVRKDSDDGEDLPDLRHESGGGHQVDLTVLLGKEDTGSLTMRIDEATDKDVGVNDDAWWALHGPPGVPR